MNTKTVELKDKSGIVFGSFRFDPQTPDKYMEQVSKACNSFDYGAITTLQSIDILPDGSPATPADSSTLSNAEQVVYSWFDTALGYPGAGKEIFSGIKPFASVGNRFFCKSLMPRVVDTLIQKPSGSIWGKLKNFIGR